MKIIETKNLWFRYEKGKWVLKNINLEIFTNELVAIVGRNGCGKTTLVKHFNGLLKPKKGIVKVNGIDTKNASVAELAKIVGYVFQYPDSQLFGRTLFEEVGFGPKNLGFPMRKIKEIVFSSLKKVGLNRNFNVSPMSLSTGEKERLAIADVLAMQPKVLILDEPTIGQDYTTCQRVMEITKNYVSKETAAILISHDMNLVAEWADRVIVMSEGRIVCDGKPRKIFSKLNLLEKVGLNPPQISILAKSLGLKTMPLSIDEMAEEILKRCKNDYRIY
jgi:energy-coupling factor transport system ATP-binding protein